jgi:sugar phosphate isomerase/epimerase
MNDRPMRLSLAAGSVLDASAHEVVSVAAAAGFDAVGLRMSGPHAVESREQRRRLRRLADELGVVIHDVEVHRIGVDGDGAEPDPVPLLDAAADVGAAFVLVVSDLPDAGRTRDALAAVVARAHDVGQRVGLEYMAWTTPSEPAAAIETAVATGAWLVVDLLHHLRVGAGVDELDDVVASGRLGWVQVSDGPRTAPTDLLYEARHARLPPGEGELPLAELLERLPDDVTVSVEVQSDDLSGRYSPADRARHLAVATRSVLDDRRPQPPSTTG